ncbi:MAG: IS4 family transposase [Gammaproteobacteria bacterium]|nr:IS4 family transposase [Gammaproteobacteria bacterium]
MNPNRHRVSYQQPRVRKHAAESDSYRFFNLLTGPQLFDRVESLLPEYRERLFPPTETLSMFLAQALSADRSCQRAVNDAAIKRLTGGLALCSTHTGAYCRARQRLPAEMVSTLACHTARLISEQTPPAWHWQGRAVRLVDGTTITMADTPANQGAYPQVQSQKAGLGFPLCRLVGIMCLSSGVVLNSAIGRHCGKGGDEQTLLRSILDTLVFGDILIGDAYYATYFLLGALQARGIDAVFEQHGARRRSTDFRCGLRLGQRDHLIELQKPKIRPAWMNPSHYDSAPDTITVREVRTGGKILVTTLLCPKQTPKKALKTLYQSRWNIELDLRSIKTTLGMEMLSCKTPDMTIKEIWVYLLAYNLTRLLMAQAALLADQLPRQLSFKHTLQLWIAFNQHNHAANGEEKLMGLFILIVQQQVGNRPHRIEPRAIKRRPKPFPFLAKPRQLARDDIRAHGHPKKLK